MSDIAEEGLGFANGDRCSQPVSRHRVSVLFT
jgi:hypothetical protein